MGSCPPPEVVPARSGQEKYPYLVLPRSTLGVEDVRGVPHLEEEAAVQKCKLVDAQGLLSGNLRRRDQ